MLAALEDNDIAILVLNSRWNLMPMSSPYSCGIRLGNYQVVKLHQKRAAHGRKCACTLPNSVADLSRGRTVTVIFGTVVVAGLC